MPSFQEHIKHLPIGSQSGISLLEETEPRPVDKLVSPTMPYVLFNENDSALPEHSS